MGTDGVQVIMTYTVSLPTCKQCLWFAWSRQAAGEQCMCVIKHVLVQWLTASRS